MVVLSPLPKGELIGVEKPVPLVESERVRICSGCGCLGIESHVRERSTYTFHRAASRFIARCRACRAVSRARNRARWLQDPMVAERERERQRQKNKRYREETRADPERLELFRERRREWSRDMSEEARASKAAAQKRYVQRKSRDPEWLERRRENARIAWHAKRGTAPPPPEMPKDLRMSSRVPVYPAKDFRAWFELVLERERVSAVPDDSPQGTAMKALERTRARLGLEGGAGSRALHRFLHENATIDERWLDYMVTREGVATLKDVSPEGPVRYPHYRRRCRDRGEVRRMLARLDEAFRRLT